MLQLELAAAVTGIAACLVLAWRRMWPEAVYCGLTAGALVTSTWLESVPRALLVAFPLTVLLARAAARRPWAGRLYLAVSGPLAAVVAVLYLSGRWAG